MEQKADGQTESKVRSNHIFFFSKMRQYAQVPVKQATCLDCQASRMLKTEADDVRRQFA